MDCKLYISSGILEDYVLHAVTDQERREVECMSKIYPEIKAELEGLQSAMQSYLELNRVSPPEHVKVRIFETIRNNPVSSSNGFNINTDQIEKTGKKRYFNSTSWAVAASVLLLIGSTLFYYNNANKLSVLDNEVASLKIEKQQLIRKTSDFAARLEILSNPDLTRVKMGGLPQKDSTLYAMLFWNPKSNEVFLDQNNLSALQQDKQYQLWAIKDGVPVDMGVFDGIASAEPQLLKMKSIDKAEAFAVTVEQRGGVLSPTLSEMVVIGKI